MATPACSQEFSDPHEASPKTDTYANGAMNCMGMTHDFTFGPDSRFGSLPARKCQASGSQLTALTGYACQYRRLSDANAPRESDCVWNQPAWRVRVEGC